MCKIFGPQLRSCNFFDKSQVCLQVYHKQCFSCKRCGRSIDTLAVEVGPGKIPVTHSQNQRPDRPGDLLQGLPEGRVSTRASSGHFPYHTTVDLSDGQTIQLSQPTIGFDGCPALVERCVVRSAHQVQYFLLVLWVT